MCCANLATKCVCRQTNTLHNILIESLINRVVPLLWFQLFHFNFGYHQATFDKHNKLG